MKRIKLSIKTSNDKHYKYLVYRSENQADLPADIDELRLLSPVLVVDEAAVMSHATFIQETLTPDKNKIPMTGKIPYTLTYAPAVTAIHTVKFIIQYTEPMAELGYATFDLEVLFDANGVMQEIRRHVIEDDSPLPVVTVYTGEDMLTILRKVDNTFFISTDILGDVERVNAEYHIEVVTVYDNDQAIIDGITYHGPVAGGLHTPILTATPESDIVSNSTELPLYTISAGGTADGVIYYYRILAVDSTNNVSDPSSLLATYLSQETSGYQYELQETELLNNVDIEASNWQPIVRLNDGQNILLGKPGTTEYQSFGPIVPEEIPVFAADNVQIVLDDVVAYNKITFKIPNVWANNNPFYNKRNTKAYRVIAIDSHGLTSPHSNIIGHSSVSIPIEKMVILRKNVTDEIDENRQAPLSPLSDGVTAIQEWIRRGGIYYDALAHGTLPVNIYTTTAPIALITEQSLFDDVLAIDPSVIPGQVYNYTIYLYDAYTNRSEPITLVVSTQ